MGWFEDRTILERRWKRWRRTLRLRGLDLIVQLPLATHWPDIEKRFPIRYADRRGGDFDASVAKGLIRLTERQVVACARKAASRIPIGACTRCGERAILPRYEPRRFCMRCSEKDLKVRAAEDEARAKIERAARMKELKAKGFKYLLELWIHPRSGGDDLLYRIACKARPTRAHIVKIARSRKSAILDDYFVTKL